MTIRPIRYALLVGVIAAAISATLVYFLNPVFFRLTTTNCHATAGSDYLDCTTLNNGWRILRVWLFFIGMLVVPLMIGGAAGLRFNWKEKESFWIAVRTNIIAFAVYLVLMIAVEVVWLQPWKLVRMPGGGMFNEFRYDAVYASFLAAVLFALSWFGFFIPPLLSKRLWRNFRPLGFLPAKKA